MPCPPGTALSADCAGQSGAWWLFLPDGLTLLLDCNILSFSSNFYFIQKSVLADSNIAVLALKTMLAFEWPHCSSLKHNLNLCYITHTH